MADASRQSDGRRLVVLTSMRAERTTTNPYIVQLNRLLADRVELRTFSWRAALLGRFDVFHVHWPDAVVRRSTTPRSFVASAAFVLVLVRMRLTGRAVVRTLHNVVPHERQPLAVRLAVGLCDASATVWIRLNDRSPVRAGGTVVTIPHGTYTDWFADQPRSSRVPGRLLYVGLLRPYKGIDALIGAFADVGDRSATLHVIGSPADPRFADSVRALAARDSRVSLDLRHVPDDEMVAEISAATLVVLPYREMHNSGAALLALSLDRPVLVPDNDVTRDLAGEVGRAWVHRFAGDLDPAALGAAIAAATEVQGHPDLSARAWTDIADQHVRAFCLALGLRQPVPSRDPVVP